MVVVSPFRDIPVRAELWCEICDRSTTSRTRPQRAMTSGYRSGRYRYRPAGVLPFA